MAELEDLAIPTGNPYVGPRTFKVGEILFGRDRETRDLTALIISHRLVLFYAPSGAGKSSLINTKILPNLTEQGFEVLPVARVGGHSFPDDAQNVFTYNLIAGLHQEKNLPKKFSSITLSEFLDNLVCKGDEFLYDETFTYEENDTLKPRVLIIDQFEEILTTNTSYADHRAGFFQQICDAITVDSYLWIILAMRDDFIAGLDPYLHYLPDRLRNRFYMQRLNREAALEATCRPAQEAGRPFEPGAAELLVDNLRLIKGDNGEEKQYLEYVEPVQLQAVCFQMWEKLKTVPGDTITVADVEQYADVDMALTSFYEQTIAATVAETGVPEIDLRNWFEKWFITEAGTRDMVFRGRELTGDLPTAIADDVRRRFILRSVVRQEGIWYELVHDRLVGPIKSANRNWRLDQPLLGLAQHWEDSQHNPERLLDGRQLDRFLATNWQGLGPLVAAFVEASMEVRRQDEEREAALQEALRQEKLEQQQALAAAEKARADAEHARAEEAEKAQIRQRWLLGTVIALLVFGAIVTSSLAALAWNRAVAAETNAARADANAARANANAAIADQNAVSAIKSARIAAENETKEREEKLRADQKAQEVSDLLALIEVQSLTEKTTSLRVGTHANDALAVLLGIEALRLKNSLPDKEGSLAARASTAMRNVLQVDYFSTVIADEDFLINSIAVAGDGRFLAAGGSDNAVRLYDLNQVGVEPRLLEGLASEVTAVTFSPDSSLLAAASWGEIAVWDMADLDAEPQILNGHDSWINDIAFSPDGQRLASAGSDWRALVWDTELLRESPLLELNGPDEIWSVAFAPDGRTLATGYISGLIQLWDLAQDEPAARDLSGHQGSVNTLAFAPDGLTLASGSADTDVRLWDLTDPKNGFTLLRGHQGSVLSLTFSPDGTSLASGAEDNNINLWDYAAGSVTPDVLRGHAGGVSSVAFLPDGSALVSGSYDSTIREWELVPSIEEPQELRGHSDWVRAVALSGDGRTLASASDDNTVRLWNLDDPAGQPRLLPHNDWVNTLAFTAVGDRMATGTAGGRLRVYLMSNPERAPQAFDAHEGNLNGLAFSRDGRRLATAGSDGAIRLWDPANISAGPDLLADLEGQEIYAVAFSHAGSRLAAGSSDGIIRIWDLAYPEREPLELEGHEGPVNALAFHPDGSSLASGGADAQVKVWDLTDPNREPSSLSGHTSWVTAVAFAPDGSKLASGSGDTTILMWDTANLSVEPQVLEGHDGAVESVAFSIDGRLLASGSTDSSVRLWRTAEDDLARFACERLPRNLTWQESQAHLVTENNYHVTCPILPIHPTVAEGLSGLETAGRREQIKALLADLWGEAPAAANQLIRLLPPALTGQARLQAGNGEYADVLALLEEARSIDPEVDLSAVGAAMADGWNEWEDDDLTGRIAAFARELAESYPLVAAEFEEQIPLVLVKRAAELAAEGDEDEDEQVLALITDAQELDPGVDVSAIGPAFAQSWAERDWQEAGRLEDIEALAAELEKADPRTAALFRSETAAFLAAQAITSAWEWNNEQALELIADAAALDPQVDTSEAGRTLAFNWTDFESEDRLGQIESFAEELAAKSPGAAVSFREQMAVRLIENAVNLVWAGEEEEALVAVGEAQVLDEAVDTTAVGQALAANWSAWDEPDRLQSVQTYAAELSAQHPQVAESFLLFIPPRFIYHAGELINQGRLEEALALAAEAQSLDEAVDLSNLGLDAAESWNEWEAADRLGRVQRFAAELEAQFPPAAQQFLIEIPYGFLDRAAAAAAEGDRETALLLMREARQLNPEVDTAFVGFSFAGGLGLVEGEELSTQIELIDAELRGEFPETAEIFRQELPFTLSNKAYDLAIAGDFEQALALMDRAKTLMPEFDLSYHGYAFADGWTDWNPETIGDNINTLYARLNEIDSLAAGQFQVALSSYLVDQAYSLALNEGAQEALALSEAVSGMNRLLWGKTADDMKINTAIGLVESGQVQEGLALFEAVRAENPKLVVAAWQFNQLCWFGALWGFPNDVLFACNRAVELQADNGGYRDSRGVARALQGDYDKALEDFHAFIDWAIEVGYWEDVIERRRQWITDLENEINPFNDEMLAILRVE